MRHASLLALLAGTSVLAACNGEPVDTADIPETDAVMEAGQDTATAEAAEAPAAPDLTVLANVLNADWRSSGRDRDEWRHPQETLEFFEVDPSSTIVEIWPGGGWYTDIIAPWVNANGGQYVAAHFDPNSGSQNRQRSRASFDAHVEDTAIYGNILTVSFNSETTLGLDADSVDTVLTFRNIHNWMSRGFAERAFADFHTVLRPGGVLGVVEHRLPSTREQDPGAPNGYVQQAYVIALAEEAGFEFVAASEINANPADTADHPLGVWTLPPVRRSPSADSELAAEFDRAAYDAIGESDRMTLLFRKPVADE
ncbi:class I SAM-dependent methyltransferase [Maricaulis maris]|jgi:predicted methyltransferase|uniref:O-methyltransferase n=1 Tax=Maricaulis maris (strain MCS10) TaxID=394221 RepID=Q0ALQ5_MARMM|nr:class I SAM-dependent methyltransferase [Maricaulis maris]ABI66788.1 O-methyltransferase [Maricaulis maris MCS10]